MIVLKKGNMWHMCEMLCTEFVDCCYCLVQNLLYFILPDKNIEIKTWRTVILPVVCGFKL